MAGFITFPHVILDKAFTYVKLEICLDEDWSDSFFLTEGEKPIDMSGMRLELYCKPTFGHATTIKKLTTDTSGSGATIFIERPTNGAAYISMPQSVVAAAFVPGKWKHFLRLVDGTIGQPPVREVWRGDLIVHAGRV